MEEEPEGGKSEEENTSKQEDTHSKLTHFYLKHLREYNKAQVMLSSVKILKKQQKAYERQYHTVGEFPPEFKNTFWLNPFPEQFYEDICRVGERFLCDRQRDTAIYGDQGNGVKDEIGKFVAICEEQPIPSMLLPVLLTIFIADYGQYQKKKRDAESQERVRREYPSIYTLLKYKRRPYENGKIIELFNEIHVLLDKYTKSTEIEARVSKFPLQLPVVDWERCVKLIAKINNVTDEAKIDKLRQEVYKLSLANGTNNRDKSRNDTTNEDHELLIRSQEICKLLNTHTLLEGKCGVPKKTKKIEHVRASFYKQINPEFEHLWESLRHDYNNLPPWTYETYLSGLFSFEDMNALMLMHCFGITIDEGGGLLPEGIVGLRDSIDILVIRIIHMLHVAYENSYCRFSLDQARPVSKEICTRSYSCATDIIQKFKTCDYIALISEPSNLTWSGFQNFFLNFCEKHNLETHSAEPEYTYQAYMASLNAIHIFMRESIANYDNDAIAERLCVNKRSKKCC